MDHGGRRAVIAAFLANLGIAVAKFVAFLATGAASMAAEAVHSLADTGNQGLLLLGGARSSRRPSRSHPFGYGREGWFWSFVVAVVLFTGGGLFALFQAEEKLRVPHDLESPAWAIGVLLLAMVFESLSLRTAVREARPSKGDQSWWRFIRRSKRAELPVVLLEDTGAIVGLVFALVGVSLAAITGNSRFDALGSLAIGVLLVVIALVLASEMKSLLIGESADEAHVASVRSAIEADPNVAEIVDLRTLQLAPDQELITSRVRLREPGSAVDTIERVGEAVADVDPSAVVYLQPVRDGRRDGDAPARRARPDGSPG